MSEKPTRFNKGVRLKPKTSAPTLEGEITVDSADDKIKAYLDSAERAVVTEDQAATLTNKTIDSASNTITIDADEATVSELETDNFKTGVIDTDGTLAANSDTKIPTQQAVKEYVDAQILTTDDASEITYTPSTLTDWDSDTDPGNVDGALDQLAERIDDEEIALAAHLADATDAHDASAISNVPSGNLAATDVQTALDELQTDVDTRALSSTVTEIDANVDDLVTLSGVAENATDLGTFTGSTITDAQTVKSALQELETSLETKAAASVVTEIDGNVDDLVTLSGVAENSTDLGTFTGTTITDNVTIKAALQELETAVEGSTIAAIDDIGDVDVAGVTDGQVLTYNNGTGNWEAADSAGDASQVTYTPTTLTDWDGDADPGNVDDALDQLAERVDDNEIAITSNDTDIRELQTKVEYNYIANPDAEVDTTGWMVYANTSAGTSPDDFGGTPNGSFTWTRSTSTPLVGAASFLLTKDAANRQGHGVYYEFTAENGHLTKKLLLSILTDTSLLDDGDLRIYLVSSSDSFVADFNVISPNNPEVLAGTPDIFKQLQLDASDTDYRLCLHYASTDTDAKTAKFDDFSFGPRAVASSAFVTDWEEYTPTFTGFGTPSDVVFQYRRVGSNIEVFGRFTSGVATAVLAQISLPNGLVIDQTLRPNSSIIGQAGNTAVSVINNDFSVLSFTEDDTTIYFGRYNDGATYHPLDRLNGSTIASSGNVFSLQYSVPIVGWSSNAKSSEDLGSREIVVTGAGNGGTSITASTTNIDFTETKDTTASFDGTTFTCPETGTYVISGALRFNSTITTSAVSITPYINGSAGKRIGENVVDATGTSVFPFDGLVELTKGQALTIRVGLSATLLNDTSNHWIHIQKLASPQTILETETVAARYTSNNGTQSVATATPTVIKYEDVDQDTHNAYNTSTGIYTVPVSGWYNVSGKYAFGSLELANTMALICYIFKNGTSFEQIREYPTGSRSGTITSQQINSTIYLEKGDEISIRAYQNNGTTETLQGSGEYNVFSIHRIK